jgi:O-antigen ligase
MQILTRIPYVLCLVLLAYMPFHIFLSQWLSLGTGGLEAWKVGKDVLLVAGVMFTICLVWQKGKGNKVFWWLVLGTALYGLLHVVLWLTEQANHDRSAMLGIIYNMRVPLFAVLGYGAYLLAQFTISSVIKVILLVSTVVAGLGVLQYFLPSDLLTHFGYSLDRGVRAAFFIEDNPDLPRIMSTLREPNALGAYLILPAAALVALFLQFRDKNRRILLAGAFGLHALAVFLTFSRSAWLGLFVALTLVVWFQYQKVFIGWLKRFWPVAIGVVLVATIVVFTARNTYVFQHYVLHSDPSEQVQDLDSNDLHILLVKKGLEGIVEQPLGHGPGTAGLVSIHHPSGQITENYYVQIGYEVGVLGLLLFIAANVWLYVAIWRRRDIVAIVLCASFWAYVVTNMLLHTWANEAVAAQWWILAGMVAADALRQRAR